MLMNKEIFAMTMVQGIEGALASLGFETQPGDGAAILTYLVKNVDSEAAQGFRKEVSDERRRVYMAQRMREQRAALARAQQTKQWTEETYHTAVGFGLKAYARSTRIAIGHEMELVQSGLRDGLPPAKVAESIIAYRERHE